MAGRPVLHVLEILVRDIGLARIAAAIRHPLTGLKVACYYGCLLARPPEITGFDDPENPTLMDQLMQVCRSDSHRVPHKTECCGASFSITDTSIVLDLSNRILSMAQAAGADCIATACPLCQLNLDMRQKDIEAKSGHRYNLPVFLLHAVAGPSDGVPGGRTVTG